MKPKIWRKDGWWYCGYYHHVVAESSKGKTPYLAWYSWKYNGVRLEYA